jgi:phosphate ABC transporter, permease protein PstC
LAARPATAIEGAPPFRRRSQAVEKAFRGGTAAVSVGLILLLVLLLFVLLQGSQRIFSAFGFRFLIGTSWNPVAGHEAYGAMPFIYGTLVTSAIAVVLAVPISVGIALLLNEVSSNWIRDPLATFVEVLAAIPSIVYGLWGLFVLKPFLDRYIEPFLQDTVGRLPVIGHLFSGNPVGPDLFTAGVILAIMIVPIVTAVTREVIATVPRDLREAAKAIGATRYETVRLAVLPQARNGIVGATMLGLGRALGETIAVAMVVGNAPQINTSLFQSGATIPSWIASSFRDATSIGLTRSGLLGLAFVLVFLSFGLAALSRLLVRRVDHISVSATVMVATAEAEENWQGDRPAGEE